MISLAITIYYREMSEPLDQKALMEKLDLE